METFLNSAQKCAKNITIFSASGNGSGRQRIFTMAYTHMDSLLFAIETYMNLRLDDFFGINYVISRI